MNFFICCTICTIALFSIHAKGIEMETDHMCKETVTRLLDDGYTYHEEVVFACCPGYTAVTKGNSLTDTSKKCEPICTDKVKNSICIKPPNTWICRENYQHDRRIDKCVLEYCLCNNNGYCLEDKHKCECYEGFKKNSTTGQCEAICQPYCENSICVANNICQCWNGYHKTPVKHFCENNGLCNGLPCKNGECLITGECKCRTGYVKSLSYDGQVQCDKVETFIGKVMITILGMPILLAACALVVIYAIAKKQSYNVEDQEMILIQRQ